MIVTTGGKILIDRKALDAFLREPNGGVMQDLDRRMSNVQLVAKALVGKRTGRLYATIRKQRNSKRLYVDVVAGLAGQTRYLGWHMYGTEPHRITAKMRGRGRKRRAGYLRFTVGGRVVFRRSVMHPGNRPNDFLVHALTFAKN